MRHLLLLILSIAVLSSCKSDELPVSQRLASAFAEGRISGHLDHTRPGNGWWACSTRAADYKVDDIANDPAMKEYSHVYRRVHVASVVCLQDERLDTRFFKVVESNSENPVFLLLWMSGNE